MGVFRKVAETKDLEPGTARLVEIEGKEIALFNVDGEFHAIDNTCTHVGGPLAEGTIESDVVTCPWHGATYSIKTGEVLSSARGLSVEGALISSVPHTNVCTIQPQQVGRAVGRGCGCARAS